MKYEKVDAGLAGALAAVHQDSTEQSKIHIFIHIEDRVYTAMLSPQTIDELSEQVWVKKMSLARRARLLEFVHECATAGTMERVGS